jgi:3-hydroxypropanoate dehydrogenase
MSGFDNAKVDEAFFGKGAQCEGCDQEYFPGDPSKLFPRGPRLAFEETCSLL